MRERENAATAREGRRGATVCAREREREGVLCLSERQGVLATVRERRGGSVSERQGVVVCKTPSGGTGQTGGTGPFDSQGSGQAVTGLLGG